MPDALDLARHVGELADRFNIKLDVRDMDPRLAGAGYVVVQCVGCGQRNALKRPGIVRCGRCKTPLGRHNIIHLVMIAPVTCEATYAVALHEIGHCLHPAGRARESQGSRTTRLTGDIATLDDMRFQLLEERSAWEWARANTLVWSDVMQRVQDAALESYERYARKLGLTPDGKPAWRTR